MIDSILSARLQLKEEYDNNFDRSSRVESSGGKKLECRLLVLWLQSRFERQSPTAAVDKTLAINRHHFITTFLPPSHLFRSHSSALISLGDFCLVMSKTIIISSITITIITSVAVASSSAPSSAGFDRRFLDGANACSQQSSFCLSRTFPS